MSFCIVAGIVGIVGLIALIYAIIDGNKSVGWGAAFTLLVFLFGVLFRSQLSGDLPVQEVQSSLAQASNYQNDTSVDIVQPETTTTPAPLPYEEDEPICEIHNFDNRGFCIECNNEFYIAMSHFADTMFYVTSYDAPIRARPYSPDNILHRLPQGTAIPVNGAGINSMNNRWYRLSDGLWIYSGNISRTHPNIDPCRTHNYDDRGFCSVCFAEFIIAIIPIANAGFVTINDNVPVRARPYAPDEILERLPIGVTVIIDGRGLNSIGNRWYRLSDGRWIYGGNISAS